MRRVGIPLVILIVVVCGLAAWASRESTLQWALSRLSQASNGKLELRGISGSLLGNITIDHMRYADAGLEIVAKRNRLAYPLRPLLSGRLELDLLKIDMLTVRLQPNDAPRAAPATLMLPVPINLRQLEIKSIQIQSGENAFEFSGLHAHFKSDGRQHALQVDQLQSTYGRLAAKMALSGSSPFALHGMVRFDPKSGMHLPSTDITLAGSLMTLEAKLNAQATWFGVHADLGLRPFEDNPVSAARIELERADLHGLDPAYPVTAISGVLKMTRDSAQQLSGEIHLQDSASGPYSAGKLPLREAKALLRGDLAALDLSALELHPVRGAPLTGRATITRNGMTANLVTRGLDLSAFHGKLHPTHLDGKIAIRGDPAQQQLDLTLSDSRYQYEAAVTRKGNRVQISRAQVRADGSRVSGQGEFQLGGTYPFSLQTTLTQLNPAAFGNFPVARLNGSGRISGAMKPDWHIDAQVALAGSRWGNQPLSGNLAGSFNTKRIWDSQGSIAIGSNKATFRGALGEPADQMTAQFDLAALEQLAPDIGGSLRGTARLQGNWRLPYLELEASGEKLRLPRKARFGTLRLQANIAPTPDAPLRIDLDARGASIGTIASDQMTLRIDGTRRKHTAQLAMKGKALALQATLDGGLQDAWQWSGQLAALQLSQPHAVQLEAAAALTINRRGLSMEALRLTSSGARFNLETLTVAPGTVQTRGQFTGLPLSLLGNFSRDALADTTLRFSGNWDINAMEALNGTVNVRRESGDITLGGLSAMQAQIEKTEIAMTAKGNRLRVDFTGSTRRGGYLTAWLETQAARDGDGWIIPANAPLALESDLNIQHLDWLGPLLHPSLVINGRAQAKAQGRGTWGKPQLTGRIDGSDITVNEPGSGLHLTKGSLKAEFSDTQLRLHSFSIHGKEGVLTTSGQASLGNTPKIELEFQARQLGILERPNWEINADIDGKLTADRNEAKLAGKIRINRALVGIPERGAPALSDDVVIKGRQSQKPAARTSRLAVDVAIDLGSDFRIRTIEQTKILDQAIPFRENKLDAQLGGDLKIQTDTKGTPKATGRVQVTKGAYTFFGKRLEVQRGSLRFDGALDNPALDILAMNKQFQVEVGAQVSGTALNPKVQLVSDPDMSDQEKLSWLLFGRGGQSTDASLSTRTGSASAGAAAFGIQLSDKLYLGYEQGVSETANIVTLYSQLTQRLSVEARTGNESALRLFYTYELPR